MAVNIFNWNTETENLVPDVCEFGISYNTIVHFSPLSGTTQTLELPGARWKMRMSFLNLAPEESQNLKAFLVKLAGASGRFFCYDFGRYTPQGTINFDPTTALRVRNATSQKRIVLEETDGDNIVGNFKKGDYFSIVNPINGDVKELKMVTGVFGTGDYRIDPPLRFNYTTYSNTHLIEYNPAPAVFMLSSDEQAYWSTRSSELISSIDLEAIEVLPVL